MQKDEPNVVAIRKPRKQSTFTAPEGQCPYCDYRRAYYRKAVAKCRPVKRRA